MAKYLSNRVRNFNIGVSSITESDTVLTAIGNTDLTGKVDIDIGSGTTAFEIQGSAGQLFSVTNNLTSGSIFSVNDVSGIPSIDVDANGTISLAPFGTNENVGIGTNIPDNKLHVKETNTNTIVGKLESSVAFSYLSIEDSSTTTGHVRVGAVGNDLLLRSGNNNNVRVTFDGKVSIPDNTMFVAGDGDDLQIYHNGTQSRISQESGGDLNIRNKVADQDIYIQTDDGTGGGSITNYFRADGSSGEVKLFHYGSEKLSTKSTGVTVTGTTSTTGLTVTNDALVNGINFGHGNNNVSGNILIGDGLSNVTSGNDNIAIGTDRTLEFNTTGSGNIAIGAGRSLWNNTTGGGNIAIGDDRPLAYNTTGSGNIAIGSDRCLHLNTTGSSNIAIGRDRVFENNDSGGGNVAIGGFFTLHDNTSGDNNIAMGSEALKSNTTADHNIALGNKSLYSNSTGEKNVVIGFEAGYYIGGSNNTIIGGYKGVSGDSSLSNTVIISAGTTEKLRIDSSGTALATALSTGASGTGINISTNTITGPATLTIDPAAVGDNTGTVVIAGDLQIDGTTTTVNSTTMTVDDKNLELGTGAANDAAADGGGITIVSGDGNKTFNFEATGDNLGSSENLNLASGKAYKINNTSVLNSTTLGSGVTGSSLTSVGILSSLTSEGTIKFQTTASSAGQTAFLVQDGGASPTDVFRIYENGETVIRNTAYFGPSGSQSTISPNGSSIFLGDMSIRDGSTTNIFLENNGDATFKGDIITADKIIHDGDTDTAIRFPAADTVAVETAGTERFRIKSNGRIAIGADAIASHPVDIRTDENPTDGVVVFARNNQGNGNGSFYAMASNLRGSYSMGMPSNTDAFTIVDGFGNDGTERFRITSAGLVGIGSEIPTQKLDVNGTVKATTFSGNLPTTD